MGKLRERLFTALATSLVSTVSYGLPVIPGAAGFGIDTPAGRGGAIYRVTNLADSGPGSLRECVQASVPRVCVFEVSGIINLKADLKVWYPNLTIAGQTAPSPGIMLRGWALKVHASDVLVQHLVMRVGDDPTGPTPARRDAFEIDNTSRDKPPIKNIVIDHCSISWGVDQTATVSHLYDNITIRNTIISESLANSMLGVVQGYALLIEASPGKISMVGNLLAHNLDRGPLTRAGQFVFVNNVVYDYASATDLQNQFGITTLNSIAGNVYRRGTGASHVHYDVYLNGGTYGPVQLGTKLYLQDNVGLQPGGQPLTSDPWSILASNSTLTRTQVESVSPPTWPNGLVALKTTGDAVLNYVLGNAGSRPGDRNPIDARVIADVKNGTGTIVNCVSPDGSTRCAKNAGGWPTYAENRRPLTLPTNPSGDDDGDGYSNLEEILHAMAMTVEGTQEVRPKPPIVAVD